MIPTDPSVFIYQIIYPILICSLFGFSIRLALTITNQKWATTYHHTITYILLPAITFTITKVISGNIALSLGMVGALSIVRFRNPVKSPFELVVYFALITIGIASSINIVLSLTLTIFINLVILFMFFLSKLESNFSFNIFHNQYDEGPNSSMVNVVLNKPNLELLGRKELVSAVSNKFEKTYIYNFKFPNRLLAVKFKKELYGNKDIISIELDI